MNLEQIAAMVENDQDLQVTFERFENGEGAAFIHQQGQLLDATDDLEPDAFSELEAELADIGIEEVEMADMAELHEQRLEMMRAKRNAGREELDADDLALMMPEDTLDFDNMVLDDGFDR